VIALLREQEKNLYKQTSQVDQMYNLLRQYDVKVRTSVWLDNYSVYVCTIDVCVLCMYYSVCMYI
jgi:hypothetical protein